MTAETWNEDLVPGRVLPALRTRRLGRQYRFVSTCASTSDLATGLSAGSGDEGLVVAAETQTGGRGRLGRSWHSPPGENLYVSVLLRPHVPTAVVPPLTLLAGGVLAQVLASRGLKPRLKWPNDLLLATPGRVESKATSLAGARQLRKAAGILTEMVSERERVRHVVLGIGINVHTVDFPDELDGRATSLLLATGERFDRGMLLADILNALEPAYDRFCAEGAPAALALWRPHAQLGHRCRIERDGTLLEGIALDVDADGALRVQDDAGQVRRVVSGELSDF